MIRSVCCWCCGLLCLAAVETAPHIHRLQRSAEVPEALSGSWQRLADGARFDLAAGDSLTDLLPGAYLFADDQLVFLRVGDGAAAEARSLVGLPAYPVLPLERLVEMAESGGGFTPESLPVQAWRWADDAPWPWVDHPGMVGGLASLCRQYNPNRQAGFRYDQEQHCYVDTAGRPVRIDDHAPSAIPDGLARSPEEGPFAIARGDLLAGMHEGEQIGRIGILVADRGVQGIFDPDDVVVSADAPLGERADRVASYKVGTLFGPVPLFAYRRDEQRLERLRAGRYRPDSPIWNLSRKRQLMVLAGMILVIVVLMRFGRRLKRRQKDRS